MFAKLNEFGKYNKNLIKSRVAEVSLKPNEISRFFETAKKCHEACKSNKKIITFLSIMSFLTTGAFCLIGAANVNSLFFVLGGIVFLGFIVLRIIAAKLRKGIFNQEFIAAASPFVENLADDFKDESEIKLFVDFRGNTHKSKATGTQKIPRGKLTTYRDSWFSGYAYLADKTLLQWEFNTLTKKKTITKRSRSGKTKTKTKHKSKYANSVTISRKTNSPLKAKNSVKGSVTTKIKVKEGKVAVKKIGQSDLPLSVDTMMKLTQSAFREFKKG